MFRNKRKMLFWLIVFCCILVAFFLFSSFWPLQELLTNGLLFGLMTLCYLSALVPVAFISSIYLLLKGRGVVRVSLWFVLCLGVFGMVIMTFYGFLPRELSLLVFPVSLAGTLLIFDSKDEFRRGYSKLLLVALIFCMPTILSKTLPYLYSPPVLTEKSLKAYNEALLFLRERDYLTNFKINMRDWIPLDISKIMTEDDIESAKKIRNELINVACYQFEKTDGVVLFYKHGNRIFPPGPGVVYSLKGINPNDTDSEQINKLKPFEHLTGNWYASNKMTFVGPRINILTTTPNSLIDRSKVFSGVSAEELNRFDNWLIPKDTNSKQL